MAVPPNKNFAMTFFLQDNAGTFGWTETYIYEAADYGPANTEAISLSTLRQAFLLDNCEVLGWRISDVAVKGDSQLAAPTSGAGLVAAAMHPPTDPWTALMVRYEASPLHQGRKFYHGCAEDYFLADRSVDPVGPAIAAINAFNTHIKANPYKLRTKSGLSFVYLQIDNSTLRKKVERKVGRPFNLLHGRRVAG